jgi:hypothetical protein
VYRQVPLAAVRNRTRGPDRFKRFCSCPVPWSDYGVSYRMELYFEGQKLGHAACISVSRAAQIQLFYPYF